MAKAQKPKIKHYKFYGFNTTLQSEQRKGDQAYLELVQNISKQGVLVPIGAERVVMLRNQFKAEYLFNNKVHQILYGKIVRFTVIDPKHWYNTQKRDFENHELPAGIFPNGYETDYVFFPSIHRFFVKVDAKITPNIVELFLSEAFEQVIYQNEEIFVNLMQSTDEINQIINSPRISSLNVSVSYTNEDIGPEYKDFVDGLLKEAQAGHLDANFKPDQHGKLANNSKLIRGLLELVKDNGEAQATAEINGKKKVITTKDYPEKVDIPSESEESVKIKLLEKMLKENRPEEIIPKKKKKKGGKKK
ncbi:MAG TPA: DUF4747 family protein [Chitinophagaceae bacterium]|nr:DUF4747 family protein [Chitinophagaceae bacterium]